MGLAHADFNYHIVSDPNKISRLLKEEGERPPPTAVLMADGWLFRSQGWDILIEIAEYAQRGRISIMMDAIPVRSVGSQDRWYDIQTDEPGESAAAMSRAARGWVGYLGDLQIGQTSIDILVCMCRIKEVTRSV
ncbi:hypothetical protein N7520_010624 [Penicillium odoratum]|uniref:uncharacterized protein n=1 Tax=Penicillium odoratum TaxID=1167516 RepID=UPI00254805D0|nr:uncharacterized protein N7520_010624 [Penicillium odoratum]KAJ5745442.1 hypothetical protein N7520_010624 [Penicillium odoratum]